MSSNLGKPRMPTTSGLALVIGLLAGFACLWGCGSGSSGKQGEGPPAGVGEALYQFEDAPQARVELQRAGKSFTIPVVAGEKLYERDEIGNTTSAQVNLAGVQGDSRFGLLPGAKLRLGRSMVVLTQGKTRLEFRNIKGVFKVQIPFATLGIRGTKLDVTVEESGKALVQMIEGKIEITRGEETTPLQGNEACLIGSPGTPLTFPTAQDPLPDFLKGLPKGAAERAIQKF